MSESDPFVEDIIKDARLIADYGRLSGVFKDDEFFTALAEAEKLEVRTISDPAIVKLQKHLNDAAKLIPFTTFAALHGNWTPRRSTRKSAWMSALLVALSITLMAATAQLTYIYNRGVTLLSEVVNLQQQDTEQRFGRLVRQIWSATHDPSVVRTINDSSVARESIYSLDYDLRKLNTTIAETSLRVSNLLFRATFPLIGMHRAHCIYTRLTATGTLQDKFASAGCGYGDQSYDNLPYLDVQCSTPGQVLTVTDTTSSTGNDILGDYKAASTVLFCNGSITVDPKSIHSALTQHIEQISQSISPYALWILPALYGALGALMFQMRRILDPLSPNPQFIALLHRVALGALAGMILAWFLAPDTRFGTDVAGIGFGLFSFAFLFGFSIDVFFTVLDEFVAFANTTVRRFGTSRAEREASPSSSARTPPANAT